MKIPYLNSLFKQHLLRDLGLAGIVTFSAHLYAAEEHDHSGGDHKHSEAEHNHSEDKDEHDKGDHSKDEHKPSAGKDDHSKDEHDHSKEESDHGKDKHDHGKSKGKDHSKGGHDHGEGGHDDEHGEESAKGPHNGRLLADGEFTVELAIVEKGVPPEYRAWASLNGKPVPLKDWQLQVELTRLGGKVEKFRFVAQEDFLRGQGEVEEPHSFDVSVTATHNGKKHHWQFPSYEGRVQLSAAIAKQSGVTIAKAGAGKIQQRVKLYGQLGADPDQVRQLKARFPGVVRSVKASIGTQVKTGETLATVEANDSLRSYTITSPITGTVIARTANEGETTSDQPLFTVANYSQLIVNLPVFPRDAARVQPGQPLLLKSGDLTFNTLVSTVIPASDGSSTSTVRAILANEDNRWRTGTWVNAFITVADTAVPLMVDNRALQSFGGEQVVFIKVGDVYEVRPLEVGKTDGEFTEVVAGLNVGDSYVVDNSYLLKADLEKSEAGHEH
jgi:cobalt-zinc-cadmium efflux system membrane fusion protein